MCLSTTCLSRQGKNLTGFNCLIGSQPFLLFMNRYPGSKHDLYKVIKKNHFIFILLDDICLYEFHYYLPLNILHQNFRQSLWYNTGVQLYTYTKIYCFLWSDIKSLLFFIYFGQIVNKILPKDDIRINWREDVIIYSCSKIHFYWWLMY